MSSFVIPLDPTLRYFDFQAPLDGVTYTIELRWNQRIAAWFIRVLDEQGDGVLMGDTKVVANWPIAAYFTGRQPPGAFVFVDSTGAGIDPGLNDLGARVIMTYNDAAELGLSSG